MKGKTHLAAACGTYCGTCNFLRKSCAGCLAQKGQMFWGTCERYHCCVETHQLEHCGWCDEFPCHWFDWNPEGMDEATFAVVRQTCIDNLQRRKEVGTVAWLEEQG